MDITIAAISFAAGYAASIYTWPRIKLLVNGAQAEAAKLRAKADALVAAIKG